MNGLPYYKAYPRDFIEGTMGMPFEVKCAYRLLLDIIYMRGGTVPDEGRSIAGIMGCSVRKWNSLKTALVKAGKIRIVDGMISNYRADKELIISSKFQNKQSEVASKPRKNKDLQQPKPSHTDTDTDIVRSSDLTKHVREERTCVERTAVAAYSTLAHKIGLPEIRVVSETRKRKLAAIIREHGIGAWNEALAKLEASSFCRGANDRGWLANFDFLVQPSSFLKLVEGQFDNRPARLNSQAPPVQPSIREELQEIARKERARDK